MTQDASSTMQQEKHEEVRYLQVHVVDEAPFKGERRQSSHQGDEVAKERQQRPQERAHANVRGARDETHKHAVPRPLMIPLPCVVRVQKLVDWTRVDLPIHQNRIRPSGTFHGNRCPDENRCRFLTVNSVVITYMEADDGL
jgi:hypothetical protein